jgi:hypothetical protein
MRNKPQFRKALVVLGISIKTLYNRLKAWRDE